MTFLWSALALCAAIWLYLLAGRGGFWRCNVRDLDRFSDPADWPGVVAVIPARDEAEVVGKAIQSLAAQTYRGSFAAILVNDQSLDATARVAQSAAGELALSVMRGRPLQAGWTGKLFALQQGLDHIGTMAAAPRYVWLTDADIQYQPDALDSLVRRSEALGLVLNSLMVRLRCHSFAEKTLVPAFIFFFQMLYPFAWVNRWPSKAAAAAGGCMLVRLDALKQSGGLAAVKDALIDDCTLGARLKHCGPVWLGLTDRAASIRRYETFGDLRRMISRSAYAQLRYSPVLLAGTVLAMLLSYALAPAAAMMGQGLVSWAGLGIWLVMAAMFAPVLRFYRLSPLWGLALPMIALIYMVFTLDSAWQHWRGRGGMWKGRAQAAGRA